MTSDNNRIEIQLLAHPAFKISVDGEGFVWLHFDAGGKQAAICLHEMFRNRGIVDSVIRDWCDQFIRRQHTDSMFYRAPKPGEITYRADQPVDINVLWKKVRCWECGTWPLVLVDGEYECPNKHKHPKVKA